MLSTFYLSNFSEEYFYLNKKILELLLLFLKSFITVL